MSEERAPRAERGALLHVSAALLVVCGLSWWVVGSASVALAWHIRQNIGNGLAGMPGCLAPLAVIVIVVGIGAAIGTGLVGLLALAFGVGLVAVGLAHSSRGARPAALAGAICGLLASLALFCALVWPGAGLRLPIDPATAAFASSAQIAAHLACVFAVYAAKTRPRAGR